MRPAVFENRKQLIVVLSATAVLIAVVVLLMTGGDDDKSRPKDAVPVVVATAIRTDVVKEISSIGTVHSQQSVVLRPQITGILAEIRFTEGALVRKGEVLARIDDREFRANLARAAAERDSRAARLRSAQADLARFAELADTQVVSKQKIDQQSALVDELNASLRASEANVLELELRLEQTRVTSPINGRVGIRQIDQGNLVEAGDSRGIVTVTQVDPISVVFSIPQDVLGPVVEGFSGESGSARRVVAFDRDEGSKLAEGRLVSIDNQIDPATGTMRARAQFPNTRGVLWPGQFVSLHIETGIDREVISIPQQAINEGVSGTFVYKVVDGKALVVPVKTGYRNQDIGVVRDGLAAGDVVVIDGQSRLVDGSAVKVSEEDTAAGARQRQ